VLKYKIGDGSFSTYVGHSHPGTGGCYTAVPNTFEGDLAGFLNAAYDMPHFILGALDLLDYEIPYFTEEDRLVFIDGLYNQRESGVTSDALTHTFEGTAIGSVPEEITVSLDRGKVANSGAYVKVASDGEGNVLEFNSTPATVSNGRNYNVTISAGHEDRKPTVMRFEFRMKVNSAQKNGLVTDFLIRAHDSNAVIMQVGLRVDSSNNVYFAESNGTKVGNVGKVGGYFTFALEYEWQKGEYRIYASGNYVGKGTSTYNNNAHTTTSSVLMNSSSGVTSNFYIDDIILKTYTPE
jgi:hypothetical protein